MPEIIDDGPETFIQNHRCCGDPSLCARPYGDTPFSVLALHLRPNLHYYKCYNAMDSFLSLSPDCELLQVGTSHCRVGAPEGVYCG